MRPRAPLARPFFPLLLCLVTTSSHKTTFSEINETAHAYRGVVTLSNDVEFDTQIVVPLNCTFTLRNTNPVFKDWHEWELRASGSRFFVVRGVLLLTNLRLVGGVAPNDEDGGAFFVARTGLLTLSHVDLVGGAARSGGALAVAGIATALGGVFREHAAQSGDGGAVYVRDGGTFSSLKLVFEGNRAAARGGAVAVESGVATLYGSSFNASRAEVGGALCSFCDEAAETTCGNMSVSDGTFTRNAARREGGAIALLVTPRARGALWLGMSAFAANEAETGPDIFTEGFVGCDVVDPAPGAAGPWPGDRARCAKHDTPTRDWSLAPMLCRVERVGCVGCGDADVCEQCEDCIALPTATPTTARPTPAPSPAPMRAPSVAPSIAPTTPDELAATKRGARDADAGVNNSSVAAGASSPASAGM